MPDFSVQELNNAYQEITSGDVGRMRGLLAPDYVLHIPTLGLTVRGRDQALDAAVRVIQALQIQSQRLERVEQHGEFLIGHMSGVSAVREGSFHGVDVSRLGEDGLIAEGYLHRPPLPPGVQVPSGLTAADG